MATCIKINVRVGQETQRDFPKIFFLLLSLCGLMIPIQSYTINDNLNILLEILKNMVDYNLVNYIKEWVEDLVSRVWPPVKGRWVR